MDQQHLPAGNLRRGDGSPLGRFRLRDLFSRSVFFLEPPGGTPGGHIYAVDVHHLAGELDEIEAEGAEGGGDRADYPAALYRDGEQVLRSDLPAVFPVPGGVIQVAVSVYGLRRMHFVGDDGKVRLLRPHPASAEGLRAAFGQRFPRTSRMIGTVAVLVIFAGIVVALPQAAELLTRIGLVPDLFGSVSAPVRLPLWANSVLSVATILAGIERALTLRSHRLVDLDAFWSGAE